MSQLKLILLDFDGTLADTAEANAMGYIAALKEYGIELSREEYFAKYFGMRCAEFLTSVGVSHEDIPNVRRRKIELYPTFFNTVTLNESLWQWCQMLRRGGVKVWIVSTGHIDNISNVMRYLNIDGNVDGIITGDDVAHPKPSPECFLKAMDIVRVTPVETIIFEDSELGLEAARRSGAAYVRINLR